MKKKSKIHLLIKVKINKTKSWFFEKINNIDKPTHQEKKREESNQQN